MKNTILSLAALTILAPAFTSCEKEVTFEDKLVGQWHSVKVTAGNSDVTSTYTYDLNLESSKEFDLDVKTTVPLTGSFTESYSGDWELDNDRQDVTLMYTNGTKKTWDVTALSETKMTAEIIENNVRYEVKFEK